VVVAILELAENQAWLDAETLQGWRGQLKTYCVSMEDDWFDQLDSFLPIAEWASENRTLFSAEEFAGLKKLAGRIVENETFISFSPNMESIWVEMKETVTRLQKVLTQDFSRDLERIDDRIDSAEKPTTTSQPVTGRAAIPQTTSIDSLFEALLQ
jgi:hypothetical protein